MSLVELEQQAQDTSVVLGILESAVSKGTVSQEFASQVFGTWCNKKFSSDTPSNCDETEIQEIDEESENQTYQPATEAQSLTPYQPCNDFQSVPPIIYHPSATTFTPTQMPMTIPHGVGEIIQETHEIVPSVDDNTPVVVRTQIIKIPSNASIPNRSSPPIYFVNGSPDKTSSRSLSPVVSLFSNKASSKRPPLSKTKNKRWNKSILPRLSSLFICGSNPPLKECDNPESESKRRSMPLPAIPSNDCSQTDVNLERTVSLPPPNLSQSDDSVDSNSVYFVYASPDSVQSNQDPVKVQNEEENCENRNSRFSRSYRGGTDDRNSINPLRRSDSGFDTIYHDERTEV